MNIPDDHPAYVGNGHIRANAAWRDAQAAHALGMLADDFATLPHDQRVTEVALFELKSRMDALEQWDAKQKRERERENQKRGSSRSGVKRAPRRPRRRR